MDVNTCHDAGWSRAAKVGTIVRTTKKNREELLTSYQQPHGDTRIRKRFLCQKMCPITQDFSK